MSKIKLSDVKWKEFPIGGNDGIFIINSTKSGIDKNKIGLDTISISSFFPYVTRTSFNNGIESFIYGDKEYPKSKINEGNVITVGIDTQTAFYQANKFFTGRNIVILSNSDMNEYNAHFILTLLKKQLKKFSYGLGCNAKRLIKTKILIPIDENYMPNWQFMEDYIKQERQILVQKVIKYYKNKLNIYEFGIGNNLYEIKWNTFFLNKIFSNIQRGKRLTKSNQLIGETPYVSSTSFNNGLDNFISNKDKIRKFKNSLSLANSGSVGATFYHPYEFIASDHVTCLNNTNDTVSYNRFHYLFMSVLLNRLSEKYSFNREINDKRIKREKIILPVDDKGLINLEFIESYISLNEIKMVKQIIEYFEKHK